MLSSPCNGQALSQCICFHCLALYRDYKHGFCHFGIFLPKIQFVFLLLSFMGRDNCLQRQTEMLCNADSGGDTLNTMHQTVVIH